MGITRIKLDELWRLLPLFKVEHFQMGMDKPAGTYLFQKYALRFPHGRIKLSN